MTERAAAQRRVMGVDISYWNRGSSSPTTDGITQAAWNTAFNTPDQNGDTRVFAQIRASRGGTTGVDPVSGTPNNPGGASTLSHRYDDPDFARNITRAANAGMIAGPYHFGRPDVAGNTGTDEANHFLEAASAWMRPGYMMPMFDLEAGQSLGGDALAQFSIDFSNRLYNAMRIRPSIYINGNYSGTLQLASATLRDQLAKPVGDGGPTMVGPAYPMLWNARYSDNTSSAANYAIPVQTGSPETTYTTISSYYGPWDDYGDTNPWGMWQYGSVQSIPGFNTVDATIDGDVSHGDIEYVKDMMVPAVWWNDSSGDWGTMTNWNSGQPIGSFAGGSPFPTAPYTASGQTAAMPGWTLPVPRLPGTAGSGPSITSGVNDTVILERPSANITVTHSTGTTNIRKLYMRETLNITGGSLTVNYNPNYRPDDSVNVLHSGPISAQFSGDVTLSGTGAYSAHTTLVDAARNFNLNGGTLTLNKLMLTRGVTPAKINIGANVTINPLNNAAAVIEATGSGNSPVIDLAGGQRTLTINNGTAAVDLSINIPITNGALTKAGAGTMLLGAANTYAGHTTVNAGTLQAGVANALPSGTTLIVSAGTVELNGFSHTVGSLAGAGTVALGTANLNVGNNNTSTAFSGALTGTGGSLTKVGTGTLTLTGPNSYTGATTVSGGTLQGNTTSLPGNITNNANVTFDQTTAGTYAGNVTGTGSFTKTGAGTLTLSGVNSYSGGTTVSGGILKGTTTSLQGNILNNANVTFEQTTTGTYSGIISGAGSLTKAGTGTLTTFSAHTYSGGTTVSGGTLRGSTTSLQGNITNNAAVTFVQVNAGTYAGNMSGSGSLAKESSGVLTLTGTNTYTGGTTVIAGTLKGNTASLQGNITNNAAVNFDQSGGNGTYTGNMTGTGSLTKSGTGTVTFSSNANTYTGGTNVQAGVLQVTRLHQNNAVDITGGTLKVLDSAPTLPAHPAGNDAFVSRPSALAIANNGAPLGSRVYNGTLDLGNNDLILDYSGTSPASQIEDMLRSGYNVTGDWGGAGITSSVAALDGAYVLAVADNALLSAPYGSAQGGPNFSGVDVDLTSVLVKFTHRADINLDGVITPDDSAVFGGNYDEGQPARWATGDMNYDGVFTPDDAAIFGGAYDESLVSLPEPAAIGMLGMAGLLLARRSRSVFPR